MSTDASVLNTGQSSISNELIDKQIHNLKILADEDQGYLFYNHKKGMFEKQTYSNWFLLALKVIFVSPWRYMFGFTSDRDYVFGGMSKIVAETEKTLLAKPDHEKSKELLDLIAKVKEATLPRMIKEMKEKRLFAQEAALVKLREQINTKPADVKERMVSPGRLTLNDFTAPLTPHSLSSPSSSPLISSQDSSESLNTSDDEVDLTSTNTFESKEDEVELEQSKANGSEKTEEMPSDELPKPLSSIPKPPNSPKGPPPLPGAFKGPPPPPGAFNSPKALSKEDKIAALTKVVLDNKTTYEKALEKQSQLKEGKINNQGQRKINEKRQVLLKKGLEKAPKKFVTLKTALKLKKEESEKVDLRAKQLTEIIERREKDLNTAISAGAKVVKTKVAGNVLEVEIELFKERLSEAKAKLILEINLAADKNLELQAAKSDYDLVLETEMVIGDEKATIGWFLNELEKAEKTLAEVAKKQKELDVAFDTATQELKKAQALYVSKEKELAKLKGEQSQTGNIKEIKDSSPAKAGADPEAIKAFFTEKKRELVRTMSKKFSLDNLITNPEEI